MNAKELKENSYDLWKDFVNYKFKIKNEDGTYWWEVFTISDKMTYKNVSCNSELMCLKICYTAYQLLNNKKVTYSIARNKAEWLVEGYYTPTPVTRSKKKKYDLQLDKNGTRRMEDVATRKYVSVGKSKKKAPYKYKYKYKCALHGIFESNEELNQCHRCIRKVEKVEN